MKPCETHDSARDPATEIETILRLLPVRLVSALLSLRGTPVASNQPSVFIDGEAGTTGLGIRARLEMRCRRSRSGACPPRSARIRRRGATSWQVDLVVLCLPDDAAREAAALAEDWATTHRNCSTPAPRTGSIRNGPTAFRKWRRISRGRSRCRAGSANPGCYPTGAIGLLRPLVEAGLIPPDYPVAINAVSGYSGGGRSMIEAHDREAARPSSFTRSVSNTSTCRDRVLRRAVAAADLRALGRAFPPGHAGFRAALPRRPAREAHRRRFARGAAAFYEGSEHVTVAVGGTADKLEPEALNGTDRLELYVWANETRRHAVLVAHLDNLGKGASGAAVQNLRLMLGLDPGPTDQLPRSTAHAAGRPRGWRGCGRGSRAAAAA